MTPKDATIARSASPRGSTLAGRALLWCGVVLVPAAFATVALWTREPRQERDAVASIEGPSQSGAPASHVAAEVELEVPAEARRTVEPKGVRARAGEQERESVHGIAGEPHVVGGESHATGGDPRGVWIVGRLPKQRFAWSGTTARQPSLEEALLWLRDHQSPDGGFDADGFDALCDAKHGGRRCDGLGEAERDAGLTGLALLAFLGDGNTTREGPFKEQVSRSVRWLKEHQDLQSGAFCAGGGEDSLRDHALATLAMCEAYDFSRSPLLKKSAIDAAAFLVRARNQDGVWSRDGTPEGAGDVLVTADAALALRSAEQSGIAIDPDVLVRVRAWIERAGAPPVAGGAPGEAPDAGGARTAAAVFTRVLLDPDAVDTVQVERGADLVLARASRGSEQDMEAWLQGSQALFQLGGARWDGWSTTMRGSLADPQRKDGGAKGSWDASGACDRVTATALAALALEAQYRHARVSR